MILFLEFDGVLHSYPETNSPLYTRLRRFERVVRKIPGLQIVICSDLRKTHSLAELKLFFRKDVASMMIGVTPQLPDHPYVGRRQAEIEKWLRTNNRESDPWCAIDPDPFLYKEEFQGLLWSIPHGGLGLHTARELENMLKQMPTTDDLFKYDLQ